MIRSIASQLLFSHQLTSSTHSLNVVRFLQTINLGNEKEQLVQLLWIDLFVTGIPAHMSRQASLRVLTKSKCKNECAFLVLLVWESCSVESINVKNIMKRLIWLIYYIVLFAIVDSSIYFEEIKGDWLHIIIFLTSSIYFCHLWGIKVIRVKIVEWEQTNRINSIWSEECLWMGMLQIVEKSSVL